MARLPASERPPRGRYWVLDPLFDGSSAECGDFESLDDAIALARRCAQVFLDPLEIIDVQVRSGDCHLCWVDRHGVVPPSEDAA